jgi:hypothetical protein
VSARLFEMYKADSWRGSEGPGTATSSLPWIKTLARSGVFVDFAPSEDAIWAGLASCARQRVQKAHRHQLTARAEHSFEGVRIPSWVLGLSAAAMNLATAICPHRRRMAALPRTVRGSSPGFEPAVSLLALLLGVVAAHVLTTTGTNHVHGVVTAVGSSSLFSLALQRLRQSQDRHLFLSRSLQSPAR